MLPELLMPPVFLRPDSLLKILAKHWQEARQTPQRKVLRRTQPREQSLPSGLFRVAAMTSYTLLLNDVVDLPAGRPAALWNPPKISSTTLTPLHAAPKAKQKAFGTLDFGTPAEKMPFFDVKELQFEMHLGVSKAFLHLL